MIIIFFSSHLSVEGRDLNFPLPLFPPFCCGSFLFVFFYCKITDAMLQKNPIFPSSCHVGFPASRVLFSHGSCPPPPPVSPGTSVTIVSVFCSWARNFKLNCLSPWMMTNTVLIAGESWQMVVCRGGVGGCKETDFPGWPLSKLEPVCASLKAFLTSFTSSVN